MSMPLFKMNKSNTGHDHFFPVFNNVISHSIPIKNCTLKCIPSHYSAFLSSHHVSFWQLVTSACLTGIAILSSLPFIFLIFVLLLLGNADVTIAVQLYMLYSLLSHIFWLPTPEGKRLWSITGFFVRGKWWLWMCFSRLWINLPAEALMRR